jgi:hypothetical protein
MSFIQLPFDKKPVADHIPGQWSNYMQSLTRQQFPIFNLSGWPIECLQDPDCILRLSILQRVYETLRNQYPTLFAYNLTPEEVFRRGFMSQLMRHGERVRGDETVEEMRETFKTMRQRALAVRRSFEEAKRALVEKQALLQAEEDAELREFLADLGF